ncbi:MAG: hypothetical protein IKZ09_00755, partial [Clostridia bacterium]|nr:hypothetical protein [Clostridia bacterium]
VPNVARDQLRHTPKLFKFIATMVKPVVRPILAASARGDFLAFPPFFARLLACLKSATENDCTLPNVARYQLRHTPIATIIIPQNQANVKWRKNRKHRRRSETLRRRASFYVNL